MSELDFVDYMDETSEEENDFEEIEDDEDMYKCYLASEKNIYPSKLLWNKSRMNILKKIGEEKFIKLHEHEKRKLILNFIFIKCGKMKKTLLENYDKIMNKFEKEEHRWVESMKNLIEDGGKAIILGRVVKYYDKEKLYKFVYSFDKEKKDFVKNVKTLSEKQITSLAKNLNNRFEILYENGKPKSIKIINPKKDSENLSKLLEKLNIDDDNDLENLIGKLKKMDLNKESKLDHKQIKGLINLLSEKTRSNDKYKIVRQLRQIKNQKQNNKVDSTEMVPLGSYDPDVKPNLLGVVVEEWNPFLTPQTKQKRFKRTNEVFRITRKGEKMYLLPDIVEIQGNNYYYIRRFFNFYDYIKQYQLSLIKRIKIEKKNINYLDSIVSGGSNWRKNLVNNYIEKVLKIHNYFIYKVKILSSSKVCDIENKTKLINFISDPDVIMFKNSKLYKIK